MSITCRVFHLKNAFMLALSAIKNNMDNIGKSILLKIGYNSNPIFLHIDKKHINVVTWTIGLFLFWGYKNVLL